MIAVVVSVGTKLEIAPLETENVNSRETPTVAESILGLILNLYSPSRSGTVKESLSAIFKVV